MPLVHERGHERILVLPRPPPVQDLGHQVGRQPVCAAQGTGVVGWRVVAVAVVVFVGEVFKVAPSAIVLEGEVFVDFERAVEGFPDEGKVIGVDVVHGLRVLGLAADASGFRLIVWTTYSVDLKYILGKFIRGLMGRVRMCNLGWHFFPLKVALDTLFLSSL